MKEVDELKCEIGVNGSIRPFQGQGNGSNPLFRSAFTICER